MSDKDVKGSLGANEKFEARNWKKIGENEFKKQHPVQKSRYLAYESPPKEISQARETVAKRLLDNKKQFRKDNPPVPQEVFIEKEKHEKLIGQLKAAEARNRLRIMRLRYQANKTQEINHLIACQPTALKAVRLQALVPARHEAVSTYDTLDKINRNRVESLLEDTRGLSTNRTA